MNQDPDTQKNLFLAIALSIAVLFAWQYFMVPSKPTKEELRQQQQQQTSKGLPTAPGQVAPGVPAKPGQPASGTPNAPTASAPSGAGASSATAVVPGGGVLKVTRDEALKLSPRVSINAPGLHGSISLKGGRIDDLTLRKYRQTVDPKSPEVILFSPANSPKPYFAEYGWLPADNVKVPDKTTVWKAASQTPLSPATPVVLTYDNGAGQLFKRTISVDDNYLFSIRDEVTNNSGAPISLYPYARVSRTGKPDAKEFFILHEGLVGVLGEDGLHETTFSSAISDAEDRIKERRPIPEISETGGWMGITDKYWAAALIPAQDSEYTARLFAKPPQGGSPVQYQADYVLKKPLTIAANSSGTVDAKLFAGAKKYDIIQRYGDEYKITKFDLMVDWGWFHFFTKPLFYLIEWLYGILGNFGVAIIAVTLLVKAAFFPLANKSYESMSKMKKLQPEIEKLKERAGDDKARLQKEMMDLYRKEGVNPLSGCLPMLLQIPVFFALYKVLFVTIDMRHAPFFGWIKDLSAPDPTNLFNLFGLLPYDMPAMIPAIGIWPLIMGVTMWVQMQLNPQQPDPIQQKIFNWMPVMFTFLLASFPAGLVIYWAWNNLLSIIQQSYIMKKQGVEIPLFKNIGLDKLINRTKDSSGKA